VVAGVGVAGAGVALGKGVGLAASKTNTAVAVRRLPSRQSADTLTARRWPALPSAVKEPKRAPLAFTAATPLTPAPATATGFGIRGL
jgi:hypothetical protein